MKKHITAAVSRILIILILLSVILTSCAEAKDLSGLGAGLTTEPAGVDVSVYDDTSAPEAPPETVGDAETSLQSTDISSENMTVETDTSTPEADPETTSQITETSQTATEGETTKTETTKAETTKTETTKAETSAPKPAETTKPKETSAPKPAETTKPKETEPPTPEELAKTKEGRLILARQEAARIVSEIITPKMTKYEKAVAICDYITETVEVQYDQSSEAYKTNFGNEAYAALIMKIAACSGRCKAVTLMCDAAGLESEHVNQGLWTHQWNRVKIDDGSWIVIDAQIGFVGERHPLEED